MWIIHLRRADLKAVVPFKIARFASERLRVQKRFLRMKALEGSLDIPVGP